METKYSREQIIRIVSFIFMGFTLFGVDLSKFGLTQDSLAEFLITLVLIVSMLLDLVGYLIRYAKGDVSLSGRRVRS